MAEDLWPMIGAERKALAADLGGLTDAQWEMASLCDGWTVRDVVAHLTGTAKISTAAFFPKLIANGFSLARLQGKDIARERGATPAATLANFSAVVDSRAHPPGPSDTWLGEILIHAEDVRRPLGLTRAYPMELATRVANFYKKSNLVIGAKKRISGVSLRATDTDWSHGEGPEAAGPIVSLVLAMTGRKAALADLTGPGVGTLSGRP